MTTKTPIRPDITTVVDTLRHPPGGRRKCHTLRDDGSALCGAWGPLPGGKDAEGQGVHSKTSCRAQGHRHCVVCSELDRQLGGKGVAR